MTHDVRLLTMIVFSMCLQGEHEIEVTDDLKQLSFYSIESGDTILVRW